MYSDKDAQEAAKQKKQFLQGAALYSLIMLSLAIWQTAARHFLFTVIISVLWIFPLLFFWGTVGSVIFQYNRFLSDILHGLSKTTTGIWLRVGEEIVLKNKLEYWEITLGVEDYQRTLYLDCNKQLPKIQPEREVTLKTHGNYIIDFLSI